jgi:hypothetical protein
MSTAMMPAPWLASLTACALPCPRAAPVIRATLACTRPVTGPPGQTLPRRYAPWRKCSGRSKRRAHSLPLHLLLSAGYYQFDMISYISCYFNAVSRGTNEDSEAWRIRVDYFPRRPRHSSSGWRLGLFDESTACGAMRYAWNIGITTFDTTQAYGEFESLLGKALSQPLRAERERVVISTKGAIAPWTDRQRRGDAKFIRDYCEWATIAFSGPRSDSKLGYVSLGS